MGKKGFLFVIWFAIFLMNRRSFVFIEAQEASQLCYNFGNYTAGSVYKRNLDSLLSSLPEGIGISRFFNSSAGQDPDSAFADALCRPDIQLEDCRSCIRNATGEILSSCALMKQAVVWLENCSVRISNVSTTFGVIYNTAITGSYNSTYAYSSQQFTYVMMQLLDDLFAQAAAGGPLMKVAAGDRAGPASQTIYSMVQCTPDLSEDDCRKCLSRSDSMIPRSTPPIGLNYFTWSCRLRYETYQFYNLSRIQEVEALLSELLPSPGLGRAAIVSIVVSASVLLVAAAYNDEISTVESLLYDFDRIKAATNGFSKENELGHGGFGVVYKGRLDNGVDIAVKKLLKNSAQGDLEFKNEVLLMAKLQHRNLVELIGYAIQGTEKLLIFEYIQNSSLDHFLFDPVKRADMNWDRRYKIIEGISRGLLYLHEGSRYRIIHRDLKPANVLISNEMNPKIADFGLAKLFMLGQSEVKTNIRVGTYGYMAPEYVFHGTLSLKIDVFSFGVLVLEIVSGRKITSVAGGEVEDLRRFAWRNWNSGTGENVIDPILRDNAECVADIMRCIHVALLCVQDNPHARPSMHSVVLMLKSSSTPMATPDEPAFTPQGSSSSSAHGEAQPICFKDEKNYTANSAYQIKLNSALSALSDDAGVVLYAASVGILPNDTESVYADALCIPDIQSQDCRACIREAAVEIIIACPLRKEAILWKESCTLRFDNVSVEGIMSDSPMTSRDNATLAYDPQQFYDNLSQLLDRLFKEASHAGGVRAAVGDRVGVDSQTIYAMVQCAPKISRDDCYECLTNAAALISRFNPFIGMTSLTPTCTVRYEVYPFYNETRFQEVEASSSSSQRRKADMIISVVAAVSVLMVPVLFL
ncbi:hypothetical protein M569_14721 [Genlisea aurea]|uniref:Uncharacterized protein n=1 Tax=Genlisea aurea TaxID=192259 RepID=S8C0A5_9LAMI|nr:hypothetical protein M569_14721 [Genlisea aurea]